MELKEFNINLDINERTKSSDIEVIQGDTGTNVFNIKIFNSRKIVELNNSITQIKVVFEDKMKTKVVMVCQSDNNIVRCILSDEVLALAPGKLKMEVVLYAADSRLTTMPTSFRIKKSLYDGARSYYKTNINKSE